MELIIKVIPPRVLGSMLFFSIAIAPKIFTVLPNEEAGKFVRSVFPTYYMYNGIQYLILTMILIPQQHLGLGVQCDLLYVCVNIYL